MPRKADRITKRALDALRRQAEADSSFSKYLIDAGQPGLGVWARRGRVRFVFVYRPPEGGARKRIQIDDYGAITLDQAREIAQQRRAEVAAGLDPHAEAEARKRDNVTVADAVKLYLDDFKARAEGPKKGKLSSYHSAKRRLEQHIVPPLGRKRLRDLTEAHLRQVHASLAETPVEADRTMTCAGAMLSFAEDEKLASNLPRLEKKHRYDKEGTRWALTCAELTALGEVLNEAQETGKVVLQRDKKERSYAVHPSAVFALRFLALTGFRRADLLGHMSKKRRNGSEGLRWSHVDLDSAVVYLEDPKSGKPQERIIGKAAVELLRSAMPDDASPDDPVCRGDIPGQPFIGIDRPRRRLWEAAKIEDQVGRKIDLHSLRHSFASIAANLEHGRYVGHVSALLGHGHQKKSITERYIESDTAAMRASADAISKEIAAILGCNLSLDPG